jgi:hypothetical protein
VEILGSHFMHLGGHGSLGTNPHTQIYNIKFHPITNNNSSGNYQVGKTSLLNTKSFVLKDGEEGITNETLKVHMSLCTTILILSSHQTLHNFCQVLFHHLYLLFQNNNHYNIIIQAPRDQHYYWHNQCPIPIISPLNLFIMLICGPS